MERIATDFFEAYRLALQTGDIDALVAAYRLPLPVVRPDRTRVVEDQATLRTEIVRILDFYRWAGMRGIDIENLRADGVRDGLVIATLTWVPRDAKGGEITRIDVTFTLRTVRGGARIAAVIAHNEESHRVPLLRSAASHMESGDETFLRLIQ